MWADQRFCRYNPYSFTVYSRIYDLQSSEVCDILTGSEARTVINYKLPLTLISGSLGLYIRRIDLVTMVYIIHNVMEIER